MTRDPIGEAHRQWVAHGWADAADGMAMVTSVVRAQQLLMERIDAVLRPRGLTFARYEVLRLLSFAREAAMPMSRLGSLLQVHPTSVTSAVDRLVGAGVRRARARRRRPPRRARRAHRRRPRGGRGGDGGAQRRGLRGPRPARGRRTRADRPADRPADRASATTPDRPPSGDFASRYVGSPTISADGRPVPHRSAHARRTRSASSPPPASSTATTRRSTSCGGSS